MSNSEEFLSQRSLSKDLEDLRNRLVQVLGERTYQDLARATGVSSESVRRYLRSGSPSAVFLMRVCKAYGINANWLFTGEGARWIRDIPDAHARSLPGDVLIDELARRAKQLLAERDDLTVAPE